MTEIASIQYQARNGGWFTYKQTMRQRAEDGTYEDRSDFLKRAERWRVICQQEFSTAWRVHV